MKRLKESFSTLKWLSRAVSPARGSLALLFLVKILQGVEGICFAFGLRYIVDSAVAGNIRSFQGKTYLLCGLVLMAIVLYWCAIYYTEKPAAKLGKNLRSRVFSELLHRSYSTVSRVHTGEWMTRINSDTQVVANAVCSILPSLAGMLVQITCAFISLFLVLPRVAWVLIPCGAGLILVSLFLRVRLKAYHLEVQRREGIAHSFMQEHLSSLSVIRTYTKEEQSGEQAENKLDDLVDIRLRRSRFTATCATGIYALVRVGYLLGVIICGIQLLGGVMTYGTMMAVLQLVRQAEAPLADVTRAVPQFFNMLASAERLIEIEKLESDYSGDVLSPEEARRFYSEEFAAVGLRDACFAYSDTAGGEEEVLSHVDIEVEKGDYVAFTGRSGCGKSTTLNILMGLYTLDRGEAYLRGRDGTERPLTAEWRGLFAYVPQENLLLSGKLREVITFADVEAMRRDDEIWEALRIACADGFVRELPQGLDTPLGERGSGLSEGQMQRIAIARAIFSRRPILMLDEATSALDEETESALLENLRAVTDRTVIIITHRPSALRICNKRIDFRREAE